MTDNRWEWLVKEPGFICMSGTPFSIKYCNEDLICSFRLFKDEKMIGQFTTLVLAKHEARCRAQELDEMGLL